MRHPVELQSLDSVPDGSGGFSQQWSTYATVRAHIEPLSGSERWQAQRVDSSVRFRAMIRYREDVAPAHRLIHRGVAHNIRAVYDPDQRRRYLELEMASGEAQ